MEMKCPLEQMAVDEEREWRRFKILRRWAKDRDPHWINTFNYAFATNDYDDVDTPEILKQLKKKWEKETCSDCSVIPPLKPASRSSSVRTSG
jgi:hypothetical protein